MAAQGKYEVDRLLADSLKELAAKRPIEKITIKEITDQAGVIRPTFYNHFQDKFELIEWIIGTDLLEPIQPLLGIGMISEAMVLLLLLLGSYLFQMIWESATIYSIGTMYVNGCMVALGLPFLAGHGCADGCRNKYKNKCKNRSESEDALPDGEQDEIIGNKLSEDKEQDIAECNAAGLEIAGCEVTKAVLAIVGVAGLCIMVGALAKTQYVEVSMSVDQFLFQAEEYPALSYGQCISQSFETTKDFSTISVQVRNLTGAYNDSVYEVSLYDDDGNCLQTQEFHGCDTTDYGFCPMKFHNETGITKYEIRIEKTAGNEDLIFLYYDTGHYDVYPKGKMSGPMIEGDMADLLFEVYDRKE